MAQSGDRPPRLFPTRHLLPPHRPLHMWQVPNNGTRGLSITEWLNEDERWDENGRKRRERALKTERTKLLHWPICKSPKIEELLELPSWLKKGNWRAGGPFDCGGRSESAE